MGIACQLFRTQVRLELTKVDQLVLAETASEASAAFSPLYWRSDALRSQCVSNTVKRCAVIAPSHSYRSVGNCRAV